MGWSTKSKFLSVIPILLGFSPDNIPIITEVYNSVHNQTHFLVAKNIEVKQAEIPFQPKGFNIKVKMHDQLQFPEDAHYLFGVTNPYIKYPVFKFFEKNYNIRAEQYINLSPSTNQIAGSAKLKQGIFIEPGVVIASFAKIGFGVSIKRAASIGHHSKIGDFVNINPGATINGKVNIGHGSIIGSGAIVLQQIQIGSNCLIGAGSVVTKDVPDNMVAYGNPCKIIRSNDKWKI